MWGMCFGGRSSTRPVGQVGRVDPTQTDALRDCCRRGREHGGSGQLAVVAAQGAAPEGHHALALIHGERLHDKAPRAD